MAGVTDQVYQQYLQMCPAAERGFVSRASVEQWLGICQEDHNIVQGAQNGHRQ